MSFCTCLVQYGQISKPQEAALRHMLGEFSATHFGQSADVHWVEIANGSGYTAGKPSESSVIALTADRPLEQTHRAALLLELCTFWANEAGCSLDHVLAVLSDPN